MMALSWRGSAALKQTMTNLKLQVPLMTLASEFALQTADMTCQEIYLGFLNLTTTQAGHLCNETTYFTFEDRKESALALVNVYLYGSFMNSTYYQQFMQAVLPKSEKNGIVTLAGEELDAIAFAVALAEEKSWIPFEFAGPVKNVTIMYEQKQPPTSLV